MNLKKTCLFSIGVIGIVFVVPLCLWGYSQMSDKINGFAAFSANVALGDYEGIKAYKDTSSENDNSEKNFEGYSSELEYNVLNRHSVWDIDMAQQELEIPSENNERPSALPSEDVLNAIKYPDEQESHDGVIENYTYTHYDGEQYFDLDNGGQVRNCTYFSNEELYAESKKSVEFTLDKNSDKPQILIYHTHATESFEPYARDFYDKSFGSKTTDRTKNIVSVGDKICEQLDNAGIAYVHDTLVHDYPSYDGSYDSSRQTVKEILAEYPSIKICLDIHRDGIEREDGTRLAPITEIDGKQAAQIMIISGCDDGTMGMPDFLQNFRFASSLQSQFETDWEGLTRPVLFDYRFYNQDLTTGSLLIEVGSHGNSLDQVQYSGELIGKSLVSLFK